MRCGPIFALVCLLGCGDAATNASGSATASARPSALGSTTARASSSAATRPSASASVSAAAAPKEERPLYYDRAITEEDLRGRSLRELSLLRNTIYARTGNVFRRPWLAEHFKAQAWYKPGNKPEQVEVPKLDRENAEKIGEYDAKLTKEELEKMLAEVQSRASAPRPEDKVELSLLSQRLGRLVGSEAAMASPLEEISRLDKLLSVDDLATLSKRDLRILRNTVYARRGRSFDSKVVRGYFETASWYKPRADYSDALLNEIDSKNIAIIRSVEQSLGGPEHENPNYGKDGWFIQA